MARVTAATTFGKSLGVGTTRYFALTMGKTDFSATENDVECRMRTAGTLANLGVYISVNTGTIGNGIAKTRKANADAGQSITIAAGATGWFEDSSGSDTVAAGDDFAVHVNSSAVGGGFTINIIRSTFAADTNTVTRLGSADGDGGFTGTASTAHFIEIAGSCGDAFPTSETERKIEINTGGTLKNLSVWCGTNPRTTDTLVRSRVNGGNGNLLATIAASTTGIFEDTSNSDTVASGDEINFSLTTGTGTGTIVCYNFHMDLETTTSSFITATTRGAAINSALTRYIYISGDHSTVTTTEADTQLNLVDSLNVSNYVVRVAANSLNASTTYTVRLNGADTTLSVSFNSSTTGKAEDTDTVAVATDDEINYAIVTGGSSGSITTSWQSLLWAYAAAGSAINTVDSLAKASVSTFWSLANASVQSFNSLA